MSELLKIDGQVNNAIQLSFEELATMADEFQVVDVSRYDSKRQGDAVLLSGLLQLAEVKPSARYLGLHGNRDNFHASIPLDPVKDSAFVVYRLDGKPLSAERGGPFRFFIPDHAACHTDEIDECANVKFVDHIELTSDKGFDNRPADDDEHAQLHGH